MSCLVHFAEKHCALFSVLLGATLVFISLGPYSNWDSQIEYTAAANILKFGVPFATPGNLINQPPIGFYLSALFLRIFGASYTTGIAEITVFGLGCVFLVYKVGKTIYGPITGVVAAGLFALIPWNAVLSRSFLIDVQCLFFSLLSLLVGIWAVRKNSLKLTLATGILFSFALLTKFFAVFTLIPLALFFAYYRPKSLQRIFVGIGLFILPAFLAYLLWYQVISGLGFFSVFTHTDFISLSQEAAPSPFFLFNFFLMTPGLFFLLAVGISLFLSIWKRNHFAKTAFFDIACLATILGTISVNMYLVLAQSLWVPYVDILKYYYPLLPPFCWLAASLAPKAYIVATAASEEVKRRKLLLAATLIGLGLMAGSIILNIQSLHWLAGQDYFLFRLEGDIGYSFVRLAPTLGQQYLSAIQELGFALLLLGLLWVSKSKLAANHVLKKSNFS